MENVTEESSKDEQNEFASISLGIAVPKESINDSMDPLSSKPATTESESKPEFNCPATPKNLKAEDVSGPILTSANTSVENLDSSGDVLIMDVSQGKPVTRTTSTLQSVDTPTAMLGNETKNDSIGISLGESIESSPDLVLTSVTRRMPASSEPILVDSFEGGERSSVEAITNVRESQEKKTEDSLNSNCTESFKPSSPNDTISINASLSERLSVNSDVQFLEDSSETDAPIQDEQKVTTTRTYLTENKHDSKHTDEAYKLFKGVTDDREETITPVSTNKTRPVRPKRQPKVKFASVDSSESEVPKKRQRRAESSDIIPMSTNFSAGDSVFAKWGDRKFYAASLGEFTADGKWHVNFFDGDKKLLLEEFLIKAEEFTMVGHSVYASQGDDNFTPGIITGCEVKDGVLQYVVARDKGDISVPCQFIYITESQARQIRGKTTGLRTPTKVSDNYGTVSKRSTRSKTRMLLDSPKPSSSGTQMAMLSDSDEDGHDNGNEMNLEDVSGVEPESHGLYENGIKLKGKSVTESELKSATDDSSFNMVRVTHDKLKEMQKFPEHIRNVSILAHVDHGKTSIADLLLATNAILSKRQAGSLRYLDSRPDEQRRGITMKTSTVSLCYTPNTDTKQQDYLINIIDSPGHIDFASEVLAAARVSDGTLIVIDAAEGILAQTITAIETALSEHTTMILIINKIDRLILERSMDSTTIYVHLCILLESINALVATIRSKTVALRLDDMLEMPEGKDAEFSPVLGNVIFASAIYGWAFRTKDFALISSSVLGVDKDKLDAYLWGDFYWDKKSKECCSGANEAQKKPMAVSLIFDTLLQLHHVVMLRHEASKIAAYVKKLHLTNVTREMSSTNNKIQLKAIMSEWLPLADSVMNSIIDLVPSPIDLTDEKFSHIIGDDNTHVARFIKECCRDDSAPKVAYVTKVYAIDTRNIVSTTTARILSKVDIAAKREAVRRLRQAREANATTPTMTIGSETNIIDLKECEKSSESVKDDHLDIVACFRVFSGTIRLGDELYLITAPNKDKVKVEKLYMLMGKELVPIDSVSAGNIAGLGCLRHKTIRTGTLSGTLDCNPIIEVKEESIEPFFKCAIEPVRTAEMAQLVQGIKLLTQTDSCAQCVIQENGQYILMTAGHVHLEKCVEDIKTYTDVQFTFSSPIVQLRETVCDIPRESRGTCENTLLQTLDLHLRVDVYPMPDDVHQVICKYYSFVKSVEVSILQRCKEKQDQTEERKAGELVILERLQKELQQAFKLAGSPWDNVGDRILALSNAKSDCCMLMNLTDDFKGRSMFNEIYYVHENTLSLIHNRIVHAFRLAIRAGPLCGEPIKNVIFIIKELNISKYSPTTGSYNIVGEIKSLFHSEFKSVAARLMEPLYEAHVMVDNNMMGKLQKRIEQSRGKIIKTNMSSPVLTEVTFEIPVLESTDFSNNIRADSQGKLNPILQFSRYEIIDQSPFEEDYTNVEDEDDDDDETTGNNLAKKLMNEVRRRKGLLCQQVVTHAEKQRTLNKKK
ncbi:uncharacterized protein CBL_14378 [Carabus blaptoides fortunei]